MHVNMQLPGMDNAAVRTCLQNHQAELDLATDMGHRRKAEWLIFDTSMASTIAPRTQALGWKSSFAFETERCLKRAPWRYESATGPVHPRDTSGVFLRRSHSNASLCGFKVVLQRCGCVTPVKHTVRANAPTCRSFASLSENDSLIIF